MIRIRTPATWQKQLGKGQSEFKLENYKEEIHQNSCENGHTSTSCGYFVHMSFSELLCVSENNR